MNLALWLKKNGFRADQVQTFYPSPMATATAMYHSGKNPLRKVTREQRRGRRHPVRGAAPPAQGLPALPRPQQLAAAARGAEGHAASRPDRQRQAPPGPGVAAATARTRTAAAQELDAGARKRIRKGRLLTQHTGLPPRESGVDYSVLGPTQSRSDPVLPRQGNAGRGPSRRRCAGRGRTATPARDGRRARRDRQFLDERRIRRSPAPCTTIAPVRRRDETLTPELDATAPAGSGSKPVRFTATT